MSGHECDALFVSAKLRSIATALQLLAENRYRAEAFRRGAEAVEALGLQLQVLWTEDRLTEVAGIGPALAAQIDELCRTGSSAYLDRLESELPAGALALAAVPDLGLATMNKLSEAGIRSPEQLRAAILDGRLAKVRGFGTKTAARLLAKLDQPQQAARAGGLLVFALEAADRIGVTLHAAGVVEEVAVAGEARRGCEIVSELVLVASSVDPGAALDAFARLPKIARVQRRDAQEALARLDDGLPVHFHVASRSAFPAALQRLTGSAAHNAALDALAERGGLSIERTGLFRSHAGGREQVPVASEQALYAQVGCAFVPPPLREPDEPLPAPGNERRLVQLADIRGMVHCHTGYSDGRQSIEQMARAAQARGMQYITITDHSPTAHYANGVEIDRLKRQWEEIAEVQERVSIRILRGTESDILRDGALDYPDDILAQLDVIIASIHNRYKLDRAAMTARIVRAMQHPLFKIWGHGLGRLLQRRAPVDCDVDAILETIAASKAAIELNGDPYRLDLEPFLAKQARALGIRFVVSVDAHSTHGFDHLSLGTLMAQRAGLCPADVLNTLGTEEFLTAVRPAG